MLDLSTLTNLVSVVTGVLDQAKDAAPGVLDAAKNLVSGAQALVEQAKANLDGVLHPKMTDAETLAALDTGSAQLKADMDAVDAAPRTGQQPE